MFFVILLFLPLLLPPPRPLLPPLSFLWHVGPFSGHGQPTVGASRQSSSYEVAMSITCPNSKMEIHVLPLFPAHALHLSAIGGPASSQAATDAILFIVHHPITSK